MAKKLTGKVALVTGGSRGIGAATCRMLADEGADVAFSYVAAADRAAAVVKELTAKSVRAKAYRADQSDNKAVERLVNDVAKEFGRLDILVNNAAAFVAGNVGDPNSDFAALDKLYTTNIGGVVTAIRTATNHMGEGGRIVSVTSNVVKRVAYHGFGDYTATKSAITGYTKAAARDLAARGITVNILQSGPTDTEMNPESSEFSQGILRDLPMGRYARPEEIAAGIMFLVSPEASYVSGIVLEVDGGINA